MLFAEVDDSLDWLAEFEDEAAEPAEAAETAVDPLAEFDVDEIGAVPFDTGPLQPERYDESLFSSDPTIEIDPELTESWPEWLSSEEPEQPGLGETGWLRNVGEPDIAGWLAAEEEITGSDFDDEVYDETGPLSPSVFDVGPLPAPEPEPTSTMSDPRLTVPILSVNQEDLESARQALKRADYDQAVRRYRRLVEAGEGLSILIADLETAVHGSPAQPAVRRLLGDAYMRNGQLQKALDTYRLALELM